VSFLPHVRRAKPRCPSFLPSCAVRSGGLPSPKRLLSSSLKTTPGVTGLKKIAVSLLYAVAFGSASFASNPIVVLVQTSNYNGYQVSCFGNKDGWVHLTVTGGVAPYHYKWSNGSGTQNLSNLPAGYYKVDVIDAEEVIETVEVTLDEPLGMKMDVDVYEYPNHYNVSCFQCFNGNASVVATGGASPYTCTWEDGPVAANRYNLGPKDYSVVVSDANGCSTQKATIYLRGPDRSDWSMSGNPNSDPNNQFIGTTDNKDLVLKSNGQERLRLKANGAIGLMGNDTTVGMLYRDIDGTLKIGGGPGSYPIYPPPTPCALDFPDIWFTHGNYNAPLCAGVRPPRLGTKVNTPFSLITNDIDRVFVTTTGLIGIGTDSPGNQLEIVTTLDRGGITLNNDRNDANAHTEIRFNKNNVQRWALGCDFEANGGQDFFLWDHTAASKRLTVDADGRVGIGDVDFGSSSLYKLYVEGGIVTRDVKVMVGPFPDYVFAPNYALMTLKDLREHLQDYGHLPGIPSAGQINTDGGVELGDLQVRMLKVVEDQALYILNLQDQIDDMKLQIQDLKNGDH
jgi:hypothetical protein